MREVTIYTTPICPFCIRAKALLNDKDISFTEIDVSADAALRQAMTDRAGGSYTVPQIFIGDSHVGGCDELYALHSQGKLDELLSSN